MEDIFDFMAQKGRGNIIHGQSGRGKYWSLRGRVKREKSKIWTMAMDAAVFKFWQSCVNCHSQENLAIDHVKALKNGGRLEPGNVVVLCQKCNSIKHCKDLKDLEINFANKIVKAAKDFKDYWDGIKIENIR